MLSEGSLERTFFILILILAALVFDVIIAKNNTPRGQDSIEMKIGILGLCLTMGVISALIFGNFRTRFYIFIGGVVALFVFALITRLMSEDWLLQNPFVIALVFAPVLIFPFAVIFSSFFEIIFFSEYSELIFSFLVILLPFLAIGFLGALIFKIFEGRN